MSSIDAESTLEEWEELYKEIKKKETIEDMKVAFLMSLDLVKSIFDLEDLQEKNEKEIKTNITKLGGEATS